MATSVPFLGGDTWRKLGYLYFTNSLDYRQVLEQNPQWDVTELPPVGAQLLISSTEESGGAAGLTQGSFINTGVDDTDIKEFFPYATESEYDEQLNKYTLQGVVERDRINGITFDSLQAITGVQ